MPTIRDVAKYANVSVGTVSNVLNGSSLVKEETRQRVLAAIEVLDFHPTAAARSLSTQRTNTIGMIRTELRPHGQPIESDPATLSLIDCITSAAIGTGTGLTFWTTPVGVDEMNLYRRLVISRQIDGLILFALRENDPRVAYLREQKFPYVIFGRLPAEQGDHWIDVDGAAGIEAAVLHLVELGHERIGYLSPPNEQMLTHVRWQGFMNGMAKAGLVIDPKLVYEGDFSERSGETGTRYLLNQSRPPTAIFCNNDRMAFGAMRAVQSLGLQVGKEVSIVGFDDIPLSRYSHPALTTLSQPFEEIGEALFKLLMSRIDGEPSRGGMLFKPVLQVRQSTGRPA